MRRGKTDNFNVQCGGVPPIFRLAEESNYMWRVPREEEVMSDMERIREENSRLYERVGALTRECDGLKKMALERHEEVKTVKIDNKYGVNGRGRVYNLQSGEEIPEDEPLFLFRGKDRHLPDVLLKYYHRCTDPQHCRVIADNRHEVMAWQEANQDEVDEPDTDLSTYGDSEPDEKGEDLQPDAEPENTMLKQARVVGPLDRVRARPSGSMAERLNRLEEFVGREYLA